MRLQDRVRRQAPWLLVCAALALSVGPAYAREGRVAPRADRILGDLDVTFGSDGPTPAFVPGAPAPGTSEWLREFVRARMAQDSFYDHVLPKLFDVLGPKHHQALNGTRILERDARGIFRMRGHAACAPRDAVQVAPWWDRLHPLLVCKDSYRPEVQSVTTGGQTAYCEATEDVPAACGCGAHLVNCALDMAQQERVLAAYNDEPIRTVQRIVQERRPFSEVLTRNDTVRNDYGELFYARSRLFQTGILAMPDVLSAEPKARPRDADFGGGVLTTPAYLFYDDSKRLVIASIWNDFLCLPLSSAAVHAEMMFQPSITTVRVRYTPSLQLAGMTGCRDCHARLDNVMEALEPFTTHNFGIRVRPGHHYTGPIKLYVRDASDMRAEGPANMQWLGEQVAAQPEFSGCVVRKIEELVWGGYPVEPLVHERLAAGFARGQDLALLLENAVVARHLGIEALSR